MPRPRGRRHIQFFPEIVYFKPRGVPLRTLQTVTLTYEELEVLRLKNVQNLSQHECAEKMKTSQSTIQRLLTSGMQKVSQALTQGMAIQINREQ